MRNSLIVLMLITSLAATSASKPSSRPGGEVVAPPKRDVPGKRIKLISGELFVPDFFDATAKDVDVVLWFLGAAWCAEQSFYDARKNAVLLVVDAKIWKTGMDAKKFDATIEEISKSVSGKPIGKICIGSFSAGFSATHDILKNDKLRERVSDVVLRIHFIRRRRGARLMRSG